MITRKVNIEVILSFDESTMDWCLTEDINGIVGESLDTIINRGLENEEVIVDFISIDVEAI